MSLTPNVVFTDNLPLLIHRLFYIDEGRLKLIKKAIKGNLKFGSRPASQWAKEQWKTDQLIRKYHDITRNSTKRFEA
jgi:hypothetical protein